MQGKHLLRLLICVISIIGLLTASILSIIERDASTLGGVLFIIGVVLFLSYEEGVWN